MQDFYDLLKNIKTRPVVYLGKSSIFSLQSFWDGYDFARRELSLPLTEQETEFRMFLKWLREKFKVETGQSWSSIILFHSADERDALDRFFKLFDEFLSQNVNSNKADSLNLKQDLAVRK